MLRFLALSISIDIDMLSFCEKPIEKWLIRTNLLVTIFEIQGNKMYFLLVETTTKKD